MERYEKYKDSGIEWIGEIPEHWEVKLLRYCLRQKITDGPHETPKFLLDGVPFLSVDGIKKGELYFDNCRKISQEEHERFKLKCVVEKNDILIGKAASIGKIAQVKVGFEFGIWSPLALLKPKLSKINSTFLEYFLKSEYAQFNMVQLSTFNTQRNISMQDIPKIFLILPESIEEQTTIANYLDRKTAEIDKLIIQKESLLKLYEEEKTAIINQAVTKGINPDGKDAKSCVSYKDSGIDWLDDTSTSLSAGIPEHWEVKKLKYHITKAGSGVTPRGGASVYLLSGIPLLRSQNIHFDGLKLDDVAYISEKINNEMSNSKVFSGDVLLNITGASIGRCFYITDDLGEANVNQHVCIIRPKNNLSSKFLYFVLRSYVGQVQINIEQTGSGREGLNFEDLKSFVIPNLKIEEQTQIVKHIEIETTRINTKAEKTKKLIELLKEYKTSLISEVVTGKVKIT